jgi:hypothetical protein
VRVYQVNFAINTYFNPANNVYGSTTSPLIKMLGGNGVDGTTDGEATDTLLFNTRSSNTFSKFSWMNSASYPTGKKKVRVRVLQINSIEDYAIVSIEFN